MPRFEIGECSTANVHNQASSNPSRPKSPDSTYDSGDNSGYDSDNDDTIKIGNEVRGHSGKHRATDLQQARSQSCDSGYDSDEQESPALRESPKPLTEEDIVKALIRETLLRSGKREEEIPEKAEKLTKEQAARVLGTADAKADTFKRVKAIKLEEIEHAGKHGLTDEEVKDLNKDVEQLEVAQSGLGTAKQKLESAAKGKIGRSMEKPGVVALMQIGIPIAMFAPMIMQLCEWIYHKCSNNSSSPP